MEGEEVVAEAEVEGHHCEPGRHRRTGVGALGAASAGRWVGGRVTSGPEAGGLRGIKK